MKSFHLTNDAGEDITLSSFMKASRTLFESIPNIFSFSLNLLWLGVKFTLGVVSILLFLYFLVTFPFQTIVVMLLFGILASN